MNATTSSYLRKLMRSAMWMALALVVCLPLTTASQSNNDSIYSGDDETIGTLPMLGGNGSIAIVRNRASVKPSLYLEGRYDEILSVLSHSQGRGLMSVESLGGERVRCVFHGRLAIGLDMNLLAMTRIRMGIHVPAAFRGQQANLPVMAQFRAHSLEQGSYHFRSWSDEGLLMLAQY